MPQTAFKKGAQVPIPRFAPDPGRRVLIAKVHVAKKEMNLLEDDYRAMLIAVTGRTSSADCSVAELRAMIEAMKAKGFKPKKTETCAKSQTDPKCLSRPESLSGRPIHSNRGRLADHPFAAKARALWISLYHLGAIENPSEQALEAFARRQLKCTAMQWANQAQSYKLVEALKAIAERHGWSQKVAGNGLKPAKADVSLRVLKVRLVERIAEKLREAGLVPVDWQLARVAFDLAGMERDGPVPLWDLGDLDLLAKALGAKLREAAR